MPIQFMKGAFTAGELSPYLYARVDFAKYHSGAKELTNMLVHPQGGISNRPGTKLVTEAKYPDKKARLVPFVFDRSNTYMLEFGAGYIRFMAEGGQITAGGEPYELETDYAEEDLKYIRFVQSSDTLFIFCRDKRPMRLIRYGHTSWQFQPFPFRLGPFLSDKKVDCKVMVELSSTGGRKPAARHTVRPGYMFLPCRPA